MSNIFWADKCTQVFIIIIIIKLRVAGIGGGGMGLGVGRCCSSLVSISIFFSFLRFGLTFLQFHKLFWPREFSQQVLVFTERFNLFVVVIVIWRKFAIVYIIPQLNNSISIVVQSFDTTRKTSAWYEVKVFQGVALFEQKS